MKGREKEGSEREGRRQGKVIEGEGRKEGRGMKGWRRGREGSGR